MDLAAKYVRAVERLCDHMPLEDVNWALTGSVAHRLQGADVDCHDLDVQTDEAGAYEAAHRLDRWMIEPVTLRESETMRSHFGRAVFEDLDVEVELMGAVQKRAPSAAWSAPTDPAEHRAFADLDGRKVPVLSLSYEAVAYDAIGRPERAALLRKLLQAGSSVFDC